MINLEKKYRNIFILESRAYWPQSIESFDKEKDLVLTFDFGLKYEIESFGGKFFYVDSLSSQDEMEKNNFLAAEFFKNWHYDKYGNDIFTAQGVSFGFAFRIEIWSEYLYYVRLRANLEKLKKIECNDIYLGEKNGFISDILNEMNLSFISLNKGLTSDQSVYYFDIHKYMYDALHKKSIRQIVENAIVNITSIFHYYIDFLFKANINHKFIYAQIYHPTEKIVRNLKNDDSLIVVNPSVGGEGYINKYFYSRLIPIRGRKAKFDRYAKILLDNFKTRRFAKLILEDGTDVTEGSYNIIEQQIQSRVSESLRILSSVITYVDKLPIQLEIMFANLGLIQTIVDCVLKSRGVPSYLIINGLMGGSFLDEAKYAKYINSYGVEIKKNYYKNAENVLCLGDPRMDAYNTNITNSKNTVNTIKPTIGIGTSGYNNLNFNSYVAVEFDFMFDVLTAFKELKNEGELFSIIIKVRPNGVLQQYKSFVNEYFSSLEVIIVREVRIYDVLKKCDLYISIYSQTLFEASCLGIPSIYYKKDKEYLDPPFDQKSELVTVDNIADLKEAFLDFKNHRNRFDAFLDKAVMEKYIGPLDGQNLERNLSFIYKLLEKGN